MLSYTEIGLLIKLIKKVKGATIVAVDERIFAYQTI